MLQQILDVLSNQSKTLSPKLFYDTITLLGEVCLSYSGNVSTSQDEAFRKVTKKELTDLVEKLEFLLVNANKNFMGPPD